MSITVSILAFNRLDVTVPCVESVMKYGGYDRLILTDNGSDEPVGDFFDECAMKDGRVLVIRNQSNLGFIDPNRHALSLCATRFFLMLNNDCTVHDPAWLAKLAAPFDDPMAALSGPAEFASALREDFGGYRCERSKAEYLEGSCLMTRTSLMKRIGLFSDYIHFAYGEDSDLGLRVRELGYTIHPVDVKVEHIGGATSSLVPGIHDLEVANHQQLRKRWGPYIASRSFQPTFVVRRQGALGDVLLITPIIDALAKRFPGSPIYVETQAVDIFLNNPKVKGAVRGEWRPPGHVLINLDMSYENMPGTHIVEAYRRTASDILGDELQVDRVTSMPLPEGTVILTDDRTVGIHCEPTTWVGKNWPLDRWAAIIAWLKSEGWRVILVGASRLAHITLGVDEDYRMQTSPMDLAAILAKCSLFIGHDSFPLHVAQSQGVPVVGLFGATRAEFILTDGSPAIGLNGRAPCAGERHRVSGVTHVGCSGECMASLSVEHVKEAVQWMESDVLGNESVPNTLKIHATLDADGIAIWNPSRTSELPYAAKV